MGKYLKLFDTTTQYDSYAQSQNFEIPSVSYIQNEDEVKLTPQIITWEISNVSYPQETTGGLNITFDYIKKDNTNRILEQGTENLNTAFDYNFDPFNDQIITGSINYHGNIIPYTTTLLAYVNWTPPLSPVEETIGKRIAKMLGYVENMKTASATNRERFKKELNTSLRSDHLRIEELDIPGNSYDFDIAGDVLKLTEVMNNFLANNSITEDEYYQYMSNQAEVGRLKEEIKVLEVILQMVEDIDAT